MNASRHSGLSTLIAFGVVALALLGSARAYGADLYWNQNTATVTAWGTTANWGTSSDGTGTPTTAPGVNDRAVFSAANVGTTVNMALNSNRSTLGIVFISANPTNIQAHATANTNEIWTVGTEGITMNSGAGAVTTLSNSTRGFLSWRLNGNQAWTNDSSSLLTLVGGISNAGTSTPYTLTLAGSGTGGITLSSAISDNSTGTTAITVNSSGTGAMTLGGANTFSGGVGLEVGTLKLGNASALGTGTFKISGGTLDTASTTAVTNSKNNLQSWDGDFAFAGTGDLNLGTGAVTLSGGTRTVTTNAGKLTVGGAIGDGGSAYGLTKSGSGTLVLADSNTFSGATLISGGTLALTGSGALASSSIVNNAVLDVSGLSGANYSTVSGQTLSGAGTVIGNITIGSGATLSPGNSPGLMVFNNDLTLAGTTLLEIKGLARGTDYDAINVGGTLTYGGALTLNLSSITLSGGETVQLFAGLDGSSAPTVGGRFFSVGLTGDYVAPLTGSAGLWTGTAGGLDFSFSEATGALQVSAGSAIPEPSTYAAVVGLLAIGFAAHRRRKSKC